MNSRRLYDAIDFLGELKRGNEQLVADEYNAYLFFYKPVHEFENVNFLSK